MKNSLKEKYYKKANRRKLIGEIGCLNKLLEMKKYKNY